MDNQHSQTFKEENRGLLTIFLVVVTLLFLALIASTVVGIQNKVKEGRYIGQDIETKNILAVSGTGEVFAKPDVGIVVFSVKTEAGTVAEAMEENTQKMNTIISAMKDRGIEENDLKTASFTISPRYEYRIDRLLEPPTRNRVLVGYEVSQSLQVKMRDLEKIGDIIQGATDAGANQVGNLQFTIDNQDELKKQARQEAISKAKEKAEEITSQLGVKLVRIVNFRENTISPRFFGLEAFDLAASKGGPVPQIETGENKISITVTITYEIN